MFPEDRPPLPARPAPRLRRTLRDVRAVAAAGGTRAVLVAGLASTLGVLPAFLLGSLAVFVRAELGFNEAQLGLAVAVFFLSSAASAIPGSRVTERVGARAGMLLAAAGSGAAMLGIALTARSWTGLLGWMALAGVGNGIVQPAGNLALARGVGPARHGLAFGIKQAAIPMATLLAGAAVPIIGLTVGWRWGFAGAAAGAVLVAVVMPRDRYVSPRPQRGRRVRTGDAPAAPLVVLAMAATCGAAVGTSLATFFVESAVSAGVRPGPAGTLLVVGSATGIGSRLVLGWFADRRGRRHLPVVAGLLALGAVGFAALAFSWWAPALVLGTLLSFGAGWGWPGLFNLAVVRLNPNAPAASTAITQTGIFVGGVTGPPAFGLVAGATSFAFAWTLAVVLNLVAAGSVLAGRRMLVRAR